MKLQTAHNELPLFLIKDMNQLKTNTHSIIQKSIHIATDFLWVGFSSPKTFNLRCMPPLPPCHSARSRRRSRRIHHQKNNHRPPGEEERSQMLGEGRGRALSHTPSSTLVGNFTQGEGCISLRETADSATPVKPYVQNDMRVW